MNKLILSLLLILALEGYKSQTVTYSHDAHGNRTQRKLFVQQNNRPGASGDTIKNLEEKTMLLAMEYGISLFPNPTQTNVNLVCNQIPEGTKSEAILFDNIGRVIQKYDNLKSKEEIPMANYKAGIYYLNITINDKDRLFYKIIKN